MGSCAFLPKVTVRCELARQGVCLCYNCFCLQAELTVDPFDGGELSTCNGPGKVHHFLQPSSFLSIRVTKPGHDKNSLYALELTLIEVKLSICRPAESPQTSEDIAALMSFLVIPLLC